MNTVDGKTALVLTPPANVQAGAGLVIEGPVTAAGVAVAPLASHVSSVNASLASLAQTLETRTVEKTRCRYVADTTTMAGFANNSNLWFGSVVGPDNKIYGIPLSADSVLVVDPATNTADNSTYTGLGAAVEKWSGGVLAKNGLIYGIPRDAATVLVINPVLKTWAAISFTLPAGASGDMWAGGVESPDTGLIYGIPAKVKKILVIDPRTNNTNTALFPDVGTGAGDWSGGVYSPETKKIVGIPCASNLILFMDPLTNTTTTIVVPGAPVSENGSCLWSGAVRGSNGKVYGMPYLATKVLEVDPVTLSVDASNFVGLPERNVKWGWGAASASGRIFAAPRFENSLLIIDPLTGKATMELSGLGIAAADNWVGCEIVNDTLYCVPRSAGSVLIVRRECTLLQGPL